MSAHSLKSGLRAWLASIAPLRWIKRNIIDAARSRSKFDADMSPLARIFNKHNIDILVGLPLHVPYSAGRCSQLAHLTILSAHQIFPLLQHLTKVMGTSKELRILPVEAFCASEAAHHAAAQLEILFNTWGSDKSQKHNYHLVYGSILARKETITAVLEIGLGTNNCNVVSNMGATGKPGASLRAFRDFLPHAQVYGADVDRQILFEEDRIRTFFVDQTDLRTFDALGQNVGVDFDLIIDDGLHSPSANIAVLSFALNRLKPGGTVVIEDVGRVALPVWHVVASLLPTAFEPQIVLTQNAYMFIVRRTGTPPVAGVGDVRGIES